MDSIYHYTVPTGNGRWSPRSEVSDEAITAIREALRTLLQEHTEEELTEGATIPVVRLPGGWDLQLPLAHESGAWSYGIGRHDMLVARCWIICTEEQASGVWPEVMSFAEATEAIPLSYCPKIPCLAVVPVLDAPVDRDTWEAVGDFERCVAWTLLDSVK